MRFVANRLWHLITVLFIASILIFAMIRLVPGNPAAVIAGPNAPVETLNVIERNLGLDKPIYVQYFIWLSHVLQGNLGTSYLAAQSVGEEIAQSFPVTLQLAIGGMLVALVVGVPTGLVAGLRRNRLADWLVSGLNTVFLSVPPFWSGLLLLLAFGLLLHVLPVSGSVSFLASPGSSLLHLLLPSFTLGLAIAPEISWFVRNGVLDVLNKDYVRTARAKGLSPLLTLRRHVVRNALLPILTVVGIQVGKLLGGAVIVEAIFELPGIGRLALNAIQSRDYPTIQGVVLFVVVVVAVINFLTDLLYSRVDPRVAAR